MVNFLCKKPVLIALFTGIVTLFIQAEEFVIIYPILHPFFSETSRGAREQAEKSEGVNLIITAPYRQTSEDQIALFEKYINDEIDAIAIGPNDDDALIPVINKAIKYGIPVITIDTDSPSSERLTFIGTDNYQAGIEMGKQVTLFLKGQGKVVISVSSMKTKNMIQRVEGFKSYIYEESQITILAIKEGFAESERIYTNIEELLTNSTFDAIITMDAESGPMVVKMWKAWGLDIPVFCFDDPALVLEGVEDGIVLAAIIQNQYKWGQEAITTMMKAIRGETLPDFIDTGIRIITSDNYNK
jgi:ribose transport system substrate-binding protein